MCVGPVRPAPRRRGLNAIRESRLKAPPGEGLTNYVLAIAAAISGLVVQQGFTLRTLPLSVLVIVIGLDGALRRREIPRAGQLPPVPGLRPDAALEEFRQAHHSKYLPAEPPAAAPAVWTGLYLGVGAYGVLLVILTFALRWPRAEHVRVHPGAAWPGISVSDRAWSYRRPQN